MKRLSNFMMEEFFNIFNPVFFGLLVLSLAIRFAKIYETGAVNLPPAQILYTIILILPSISIIIIPLAFLISISITTTKLCSTNEITALQTSGISETKLFKIYLMTAIYMIFFYIVITVIVKPYSNLQLKRLISNISSGSVKLSVQEKSFNKISDGIYIYTEKSGDEMEDVLLFQKGNKGEDTIIFADRANFLREENIVFRFYNGNYFKTDKKTSSFMDFKDLYFNPFSDSTIKEQDFGKGTLSTLRLWEKIVSKKATPAEQTEFINRFFSPVSLLIFLMLSFPLSLTHSRNYKTWGISISIIVGLVYFILSSLINTFSLKGFINPFAGIIGLNIFLLLISFTVFYKKVLKKT